jgi:endonuclease/exonuclease/phosphatase (EEP) superfamily protein YafD
MRLRWVLLGVLVTALLVPAALLTFSRLAEPVGGAWVRLVSFTPFATLLYAGALMLLLLAGWRGRGRWRAAARALSVVALAGALLHAGWASGPYLGTSRASADSGRSLRVMTANLRFGEGNARQVVDAAQASAVHVLALQEVTPEALVRLERAGLRQRFPHSAGRAEPGTKGSMVFSVFPLERPARLSTSFGSYAMTVRTPDGAVDLLAVHPRPPVGDARAWWAEHAVIRSAARATSGPTLLMGDFNATMDHRPMRELSGRGFADAATEATSQWQPTWPSAGEVTLFGLTVPSLLPIDHVLARGGPVAVRTQSVTIEDTDHRALVAVLRP